MERAQVRVPMWAVTKGPKHHFFGYYDKCPWDPTGRYLLAVEVDFNDRLPGPDDEAVIGIIDLENNNRFEPVARTRAWNWQQGAMAQWVPSDTGRWIIYNDRLDDQFVSVLVDIHSGKRRVLPIPIYALSPDGRFALSVDFDWLSAVRPGYGYATTAKKRSLDPENSGIYRIDLATGKFELVVSYAQVQSFQAHPIMEKATHWIEHLLISPDSTRFLFLHRFTPDGHSFYTRLLTANPDGSELFLLAESMVSHYCWRNGREILAWTRRRSLATESKLRSLLKSGPLKHLRGWLQKHPRGWVRQHIVGDCFLLFTDRTRDVMPVGLGILTEDAHISFSPDGRWLLGDTYPDVSRYRTLFLYDPQTQRLITLGRFYSPPELSGAIRCDLHARWSRDGKEVCIDSAHDGNRQLYILDVSTIIEG